MSQSETDIEVPTLTLDLDGGSGDGLSQIVGCTAHVDSFISGAHSSDVQGNVAKVVGAVNAGACRGSSY